MEEQQIDPPAPMTKEQKDLIDMENHWRQLFAEDPSNNELNDPHLGLMNVYENENQFHYEHETEEEEKVPKILTQFRQLDLSGSAINRKDEYLKNWREFTQGCLDGLNWDNVFAAGGAVLGCLSADQDGYRGSDIDLFIYGITDEAEANKKLREVYSIIVKNTQGRGDVIRTNRALTILCSYPFRHVQIILRLYKSPGEVLLGFDIDSCCVGYDGTDLWCMERFRRALTKRYNLVNVSRRSVTYEQRLFKYSKRGFAVAIPNLDKSRINSQLFQFNVREVKGLAKLMIYDYNQNTGRSNFSRPGRRRQRTTVDGDQEEGSDYNNDLPIPWGPDWDTDKIINLLNIKNKAKFFSSIRRNKKQEEQGEKPPTLTYNHLFTSNAQKLESGEFSVWKRSLDGVEIQKPIEWIKDNPAYQDYDNGFRRLMTGSFEPCIDNWEEGVYAESGQQVQTSSISQNQSSMKKTAAKHRDLFVVPSPEPVKTPLKKKADKISMPSKPNAGLFSQHAPFEGVYTGSTDPSVYGGGGYGVSSSLADNFSAGGGGGFQTTSDVSAFGGGTVPVSNFSFGSTAPVTTNTTASTASAFSFGSTSSDWNSSTGFGGTTSASTGFGSTTSALGGASSFAVPAKTFQAPRRTINDGPSSFTFSSAGTSGFGTTDIGFGGATTTTASTFGGIGAFDPTPGFGSTAPYGSTTSSAPFGGWSDFGATSGTVGPSTSFSFGSNTSSNIGGFSGFGTTDIGFGGATTTTASTFGTTGSFGTTSSNTGGFGGPTTSTFGGFVDNTGFTSSTFGAPPGPFGSTTSTSTFGAPFGGFGNVPSTTDTSSVKTATTGFSFGGAPTNVTLTKQNRHYKAQREKQRTDINIKTEPTLPPVIDIAEDPIPETQTDVAPWLKPPTQNTTGSHTPVFTFPPPPPSFTSIPSHTTAPQPLPAVSLPTNSGIKSPVTKLLLLVALAFKKGALSDAEKGKLKDLILQGNALPVSALEVFEIDQDLDELIDTFKRICRFT